ncbi:major facilitator superfamily domain-containing protein [Cyathus striatus]|nr:major facilitator superfamily domain-containing protein [Cyathus striatus]
MELEVLPTDKLANSLSHSLALSHRSDAAKQHTEVVETPVEGTYVPSHGAELPAPTKEQMKWHWVQYGTLCWTLFLAGWNDGTLGPLLPRIQEVYNLNFIIVSLVFILACGFISGAVANVYLNDRVGFGKIIALGSVCQIVAYTLQSPGLPFPVFAIAFVINGFGIAIQDAQANGYVASYKSNAAAKMGILHATYGLGAFAAPLVSTQFAHMRHWSFHYLVSLVIGISNTILLVTIFRLKSQDECLAEIGQPAGEKGTSEHSAFRQILSQKAVHLLAFFVLVYVGIEVTIGGWIVTFIVDVRGGGPDAGYIAAGFFGGLTLGRVILLWVNEKVGERRVLYIYAFLAVGLELIVWLVPSLIGDAVAVSIIGVLLGPMYPIAMNHAGRILPAWILTASIGWIAGFGQAGSAVLPFMTGAIANKHGIKSLHPLIVAMMGLMVVLWTLVPRKAAKQD